MNIYIPVLGMTNHGGVRVLVQLANQASKMGHNVIFLAPKGKVHYVFELNSNILVNEVGLDLKSKILSWLCFIFVCPFYIKNGIVIANHFVTYFIAFFSWKKDKFIYLVQGLEFKCYSGILGFIAKIMCYISYKSKFVFAANKYLFEELRGYGNPIGFLNLGISNLFINKYLNKNKKYDFIYFLRNEKYKRKDRFDRLLSDFDAIGISFVCVSQDECLLDEYKNKGLTCYQPQNDNELIEVIDQCKLMLLTSEHEGFALPPLECMARGVVPIMYECGGPSNYAINNYNSIIVSPDDDKLIISSLNLLINDEILLHKMSNNALKTSKNYDFDSELENFINTYLIQ
ncbi:glycosyltransferase family 4 protein [Budviciaceae bacterium CWB-B4]|uniref:Glycosyltransferase family 4 protein n=1 Tax=Limnobaculum xujianqingii TaxID=2738837 RepID=A0A9D7AL45_9GAMM|nr:glycosyltransferase family 4 protein [Limnobaculum xujianqingii]MBK5074418.1 glycosyltransferase family 4 protein [Limnobaculum xujianqingii]MBK5177916.1 glycosyltransferase family 4 protein [Limnobaculum xujianqingii]